MWLRRCVGRDADPLEQPRGRRRASAAGRRATPRRTPCAPRSNTAWSRPSCRWRAAIRCTTFGAISSVIQRASSAATRCSVPRIGHVRTSSRRAMRVLDVALGGVGRAHSDGPQRGEVVLRPAPRTSGRTTSPVSGRADRRAAGGAGARRRFRRQSWRPVSQGRLRHTAPPCRAPSSSPPSAPPSAATAAVSPASVPTTSPPPRSPPPSSAAASPAGDIEDVWLGCANQAGEDNRNVARFAALLAGLPDSVGGVTVNRLCASGLSAVVGACHAVVAGDGDLFVAGGVESMTRAPLVTAKPTKPFERGDRTMHDTTLGWRFVNPAYAASSRPRRWARRARTWPSGGASRGRTRTRSRSGRSSAGPRPTPPAGSPTSWCRSRRRARRAPAARDDGSRSWRR